MPGKLSLATKTPREFPKTATFPAPPRFLVQDSPTNPRGGLQFFEYWKEIAGTKEEPKDRADLVSVKFYLHIPVVMYKLVDPKRTNLVFAQVEGPMWFENPEDYETEVPKRFGAARWHVLLNEAGVHGHLMHSYFSAGSWDDYPLQIDLRTLVRSEPKNADYIQWLKKTGVKTPWDTPEDEDEMQTGDVIKVVVDGMRETNQLIREKSEELADVKLAAVEEELDRAREERQEAKAAGTIDAAVVNAGMELLANAANKSIDMVAQHAGSQLNTVEVMKTAAELFRPQTDSGTTMLLEALKDQSTKMLQMQESNQEFMRSVIGMKKNQDGSWSGPDQHQQGGVEAELARFQRLADVLGWQKPGQMVQQQQNAPQVEHPPEKGILMSIAENIGPFSAMLTTVTVLIANMVYNFRAEPGKTMSPQEALQRTQAAAPPPQQQQQQIDPKDIRNWMTFGKQIEQVFKTHFRGQDQGLSGFTFAEFLLSNGTGGGANPEGRKTYMSIKENLGPVGFDKLVRATPTLWEEVKATPDAFRKFVEEFFSYDEMMAQQPAGAAV